MHRNILSLAPIAAVLAAPAALAADTAKVDPFAPEAPPVEEQLAADTTAIPAGQGAVFVPRLTVDGIEPPVLIVDKEEVASGSTGARIPLPPGRYTVIVGSTTPAQSVAVSVEVKAGETTVVPVKWGALRVEVSDEKLLPVRGTYDLIRLDTREVYGTGYGADTLQGEELNVWLLPPGLYKIVQQGANWRSRTDFATVYVPEGGLVRYRLVVDPDDGTFRGAGVLIPGEPGAAEADDENPWTTYLVVGADGAFSQTMNVVGTPDQLGLNGALFADGYAMWTRDKHSVSTLLQIEEGASWVQPASGDALPLVKTDDYARLDALYTFLVNPWVGPYVRASGTTQFFPTDTLTTEDLTVVRTYTDGTTETEQVAANDTYRVAESFLPTLLREGVGLNARLFNNRYVTLAVRAGAGLRQNLYGGTWVVADDASTPELELNQVDSFNQVGLESTVHGVFRPLGWLVWSTDLELFADFQDIAAPAVEWNNTVTLRLSEILSLTYDARLVSEPQVTDALQFDHAVLLRASWAVF